MSIDRFHKVAKGENPRVIESLPEPQLGARPPEGTHTIYEIRTGVEHLYLFEDGAEAAGTFERWRRQPCERIVLTLDCVEQVGERLPANSVPDTGCDVDILWDGDFDTDGDPNGPARWKVCCGCQTVDTLDGRTVCDKHCDQFEEAK